MNTELPVTAVKKIKFEGGMLLAAKGAKGVALVGMKPNRPQHYGLVPVRWHGRQRAFWLEPALLNSRYRLARCVTLAPTRELDLSIPKGKNGEYAFGHNLKMFRRARKLSQEDLAQAMNSKGMDRISQTGISNWENRQDCPSGTFLTAAAAALGVPAFAFFIPLNCVTVVGCLEYVRNLKEHVCLTPKKRRAGK